MTKVGIELLGQLKPKFSEVSDSRKNIEPREIEKASENTKNRQSNENLFLKIIFEPFHSENEKLKRQIKKI